MPPPSPQVETGRRTPHRRCPPHLLRSFFLHDFAPSPAIVRPWPRQRRGCGMPAVIRFEVFIAVVVIVVIILGLDILCCGHRHLSRWAVASLVAPPPLSPRRRHYCRANACLIAPLSRQRLVVASSPLSPRQCLSCCGGASLVVPVPLLLRRGLSCGASPAPAGCGFANYLNVPPSLLSRQLVVALLPLSLRRCLSLCHLSHCAAVSLSHRPSQPQQKAYRFIRGVFLYQSDAAAWDERPHVGR
jgi:hypothetical protein